MTLIAQFLLGYRIFTVKEEQLALCAQIFLREGISVRFKNNTFAADVIKSRRIDKVLDGNIEYSKSDLRGVGGFFYKNRKRYGVMFAIVFSMFLFFISTDRVWDIRIEGCEESESEKIKEELMACGFTVGSSWSSIDLSELEIEVLSKSESVSWLNINRRGTVAYVTVLEKQVHEHEKKEGYSNIIAECDAVIEEITVVHGVASVKVGDSVKKGDLLISGVLPEEQGGGFCYAEGQIIGRVSATLEVAVPEKRTEKNTLKSKISRLDLKIFDFSVNIFNSYRNSDSECDIIDTEKCFSLFGKKLPISILKTSAVYYSTEEVAVSEEEMISQASSKMSDLLSERLEDSTLLKLKTDGGFTNGGYSMISDFVCTEQIGCDLPFEVKIP